MSKILIIEDRRDNIVFIANNILKPQGHEVITAMDGQTGLMKAQKEKPNLIITDLKLPRMGGLEVLEQLNEKGLNIPAIVMTFHGTEDTAMRALRLGARDYLIKPFTIEEMQASLDRALMPVTGAGDQQDASNYQQLEEELAQTRKALMEREDQLKRLSTASQMASKVPRLEQELARTREVLAQQQGQPGEQPPRPEGGAMITELEQELAQTQKALATRENQLKQVRHYLNHFVKKTEYVEVTRQAAALKDEKTGLNEALTQAKEDLNQSQQRVDILEGIIRSQKLQLDKYQNQAMKLAEELRNLSEAVRLLSQDLKHQTSQLEAYSPSKEKN